ncbi:maleylpyruvate isomerase N-terminal domain-containing protein [Mumia sp. ZJ430]|uniref:maleylpyruvate isomerase N-terminal domain-containing protein n=1 Tax=Mumia sp. ZJ430 TaxID=2708083 RepID=UPI001421455A|nr:maleylpyruvate isomerase N-terminal domain-containing protein [Mumia sp. ZJ430]
MDPRDAAFVTAAHIAAALLTRPEVAAKWGEPSALPRMTVGMLACHLGRQTVAAGDLLGVDGATSPLPDTAEHYRRAAWVTATSLDDPAHDRTRDEQEAALGLEALQVRCATSLANVERLLEDGEVADVVAIPWQGWSLTRSDFLLTRMLEIVVHTDDLARSIDLPTPEFPDDAYLPVVHLLVQLAAERHGQAALTSALTRSERMPEAISAF